MVILTIRVLKLINEWCPEVGSNHRHKDFQNIAPPKVLANFKKYMSLIKNNYIL